MTRLAIRLLRAFAAALEQPDDAFESVYRDAPNQHIKILRYPGRDARIDLRRLHGRRERQRGVGMLGRRRTPHDNWRCDENRRIIRQTRRHTSRNADHLRIGQDGAHGIVEGFGKLTRDRDPRMC
ncbi:hypothetical protein [Paraburkholderia atlantica]|uniref:hypothetical protein n=1 Tax=Paraburkholderia atlantica TaxID=2654982 RepID=UPI001794C60F|nr:hypothetical protein [Paraburkholderia atlantica]MBB5510272.1 hypothetical protein [Paraburkholderia atlantica]